MYLMSQSLKRELLLVIYYIILIQISLSKHIKIIINFTENTRTLWMHHTWPLNVPLKRTKDGGPKMADATLKGSFPQYNAVLSSHFSGLRWAPLGFSIGLRPLATPPNTKTYFLPTSRQYNAV